ncbi:PREDICTED: uncharacterized protein LOC108558213, partial [Nicrophorus vespilloides]|uniref:Uncharacterized protein LOC108558213 n=1 Tax=Nicrophorus vespilloides TaxID=110193 RepID=A0ABM1M7I8_NICVS
MHRIPHGRNSTIRTDRPPVLLMHGLSSSSADWVNTGPERALGFILADIGYDVWLGNSRGNKWGRNHTTLNPDHDKATFWNFSWHEIGKFDLPALIDHILELTQEDKLFYIGHSQGTTAFFVMASERPEYNDKIRLMSALAPVAYMDHADNPINSILSQFEESLEWISKYLGMYEFLPDSEFYTIFGKEACDDEAPLQEVCTNVVFLICGFDSEQLNATFIPVILSNIPSGSATKQYLHYAQGIKYGTFRQYNYHKEEINMKIYGQPIPPDYVISNIRAPVALHYGQNDWMASVIDVERLKDELPNVVTVNKIAYEKFNHLDFLWANDVNELLYNDLLADMLKRHINITTEDGYLLELHRIPYGKTNQTRLGPVLLMHGLLTSSADWCNGGAKNSLAFFLADAGYDVWMGNFRGNTWSRKHRTLDPDIDESAFWNFSWHEMGFYDLPAKIDYILKVTGEEKLQYVGHSQGTCAFWVMASMKPEYNKKIKLMSALAPIAFMKHVKTPFATFFAPYEPEFVTENYFEVFQRPELFRILGRESLIPVVTTNTPAGASIKQFLHFFQSIQFDYFRQYDYHSEENNLKHYGQLTPPDYDLTKITAPVAIYYAQNDWLSSMEFELIKKYGYPLERHVNVTTKDGYLLELHRIPQRKINLGPVLLMHGVFSSSADWCNGGANKSLAFLLADAGYDVWMGNSRGNTWSRKHRTLNPDVNKSEYWNFSWHEIGIYDLPAMIDYILEVTGKDKLQYIGYSQGTVAFWVMASTKPEYNNKVKLMNALAPVAFMKQIANPFIKFLAQFEYTLSLIAKDQEVFELLRKSELLEILAREICHDGSNFQELCSTAIFLIFGFDPDQLNSTLLPVFLSNAPAGASSKQVLHFLQSIRFGHFRQYDYHSKEENIRYYGQPSPPDYNLSKINVPIALHYAQNDWLSSTNDVDRLIRILPNMALKNKINFQKFNHIDFIWSIDIVELGQGVLIAVMCESVTEEGRQLIKNSYGALNRFSYHQSIKEKLFILAQQTNARYPIFTAAGFFKVDYSILFTFLNLIATYAI